VVLSTENKLLAGSLVSTFISGNSGTSYVVLSPAIIISLSITVRNESGHANKKGKRCSNKKGRSTLRRFLAFQKEFLFHIISINETCRLTQGLAASARLASGRTERQVLWSQAFGARTTYFAEKRPFCDISLLMRTMPHSSCYRIRYNVECKRGAFV
jgi:hypothetical protein